MSKTEKTLKTSNSAEVNWSRGVERGQKRVKKRSKGGQKGVTKDKIVVTKWQKAVKDGKN